MDAQWRVLETGRIDRVSLKALFANELAAIRLPEFVSSADCNQSVFHLLDQGFTDYVGVTPAIGRLGITQFEHGNDSATYFRDAAFNNARRRQIFRETVDPVERVRFALTEAWGRCVDLAENDDGAQYFAGLVRYIDETLNHLDWAPLDAPTWSISHIIGQLAWNIYYAVPPSGGELEIFQSPWEPQMERFHLEDSYGYSIEAVRGRSSVVLKPRRGELILFNSRNIHRVLPSGGVTKRISASSFAGLFSDGNIALWS